MNAELINQLADLLNRSVIQWHPDNELTAKIIDSPINYQTLLTFSHLEVFVLGVILANGQDVHTKFIEGKVKEIEPGVVVRLKVPCSVTKFIVAENLDKLLSNPTATRMHPQSYILTHDLDGMQNVFSYTGESCLQNASKPVKSYHKAIDLWGVIKSQADHTDDALGYMLFFGIRRTEIKAGFSREDLSGEILSKKIGDFINNEDRKKTRSEIFRHALSDFLKEHNPKEAFSYLLRESARFELRLREGLALFLTEHTPDKLAEEGKQIYYDIAEKIDKTVSSIELKSLTIPISLLLIVKEVERGQGLNMVNSCIVLAMALYVVAMSFALSSHVARYRVHAQHLKEAIMDLKARGLAEDNKVLTVDLASLQKRSFTCLIGALLSWVFSLVPAAVVVYFIQ